MATVYPPRKYEPVVHWTITALDEGQRWTTYGRLLRSANFATARTEYEACKQARKQLRVADAALLKRLDFDPENAGTGITAASRDDLARALAILELTP